MKYALALLFLAAATCHGTLIDLGPPQDKVVGEHVYAWEPDITSLDGQTITMDLIFANDEFIRIRETASVGFIVMACLRVNGTGIIYTAESLSYSLDSDGLQNSLAWDNGISSITTNGNETFNFPIGSAFPVWDKPGAPLDVYGLHTEFTLPDTDHFTVVGGSFIIGPNGYKPWQIGPHVPDNGSTIALLALSVGVVFVLRGRFNHVGAKC